MVSMVTGGFLVCGRDFVTAWVGNKRIVAYWVGLALLIIFSVDYSSYSSLSVQRAYGKHKIPALINFGVTILNVIISVLLLYILPSNQSIVACLAGTAFATIFGKWIVIPIYNKKSMGLPIKKFYKNYGLFMGISIFSCVVTIIIWNLIRIAVPNSYWIHFLVKGLLYSMCYLAIIVPMNFSFFRIIIKK